LCLKYINKIKYILCLTQIYVYIHSLVFSLKGRAWQEPEPSHVTGTALAHCILGKFLGVVCHFFPPPLDVLTLAARCLRPQQRERSQQRKVELCPVVILPEFRLSHKFTCRKSTTWDRRLHFPSEGRRAEDFFALPSAGFEPANFGTKGQHATPRPPKPVCLYYYTKMRFLYTAFLFCNDWPHDGLLRPKRVANNSRTIII